MKRSIYLDYAAATPMDPLAVAAMQPFLGTQFYNPSALYQPAREVRQAVETARSVVANVLGSKDQEIIFTAGGTEANNLAIQGVMEQFPEANIVISSIEHESVLEPAKRYPHVVVPVDARGMVDLTALEAAITQQTVLVSVMYANNEVGTIQPMREIASLIAKKRAERQSLSSGDILPLYFHTDAAQASNYLDLQVSRLNVDMMTLNGGKIYASKQSGCLYIRKNTRLQPLIVGGGQESGLRSGTENVASLSAFATMLQKVQSDRHQETKRLKALTDTFFAILSQKIPEIILNGDKKRRLPNNLNITIPGVDGERLVMELDEQGVLLATGSACTASNDEPSHVLLALGIAPVDANASLRLTLGRYTTDAEVSQAIERLTQVISMHARLA